MVKKLTSRANKNGIRALKVDLETGLTLAAIALQAPAGSEKRLRNRRHARKAYDAVTHFSERFTPTETEAQEIKSKLKQLRSVLQGLGESF